jgi:predicted membrane GTPase involved in stress response
VLIAKDNGTTTGYSLDKLQDRGYFLLTRAKKFTVDKSSAKATNPVILW